jgi:hypothetical protein
MPRGYKNKLILVSLTSLGTVCTGSDSFGTKISFCAIFANFNDEPRTVLSTEPFLKNVMPLSLGHSPFPAQSKLAP